MTELTKEDFVTIYQDAIYELNAEILFSVAYTETKKDVYELKINSKTLKKEIDKDERKNVIQDFIKKFFKGDIEIKNQEGKVEKKIESSNFNEKLKHFKDILYNKKKEYLIKNIIENFP